MKRAISLKLSGNILPSLCTPVQYTVRYVISYTINFRLMKQTSTEMHNPQQCNCITNTCQFEELPIVAEKGTPTVLLTLFCPYFGRRLLRNRC